MRHRVLVALTAVVSGVILAVRVLARKRSRPARVDEVRGPVVMKPAQVDVRVEPAEEPHDEQEPSREATASWLPADWSADDPAPAPVSSCSESDERDRGSRWLPAQVPVHGDTQALRPVASDAPHAPKRVRRWAAPARRQTLGGVALALAVAAAALVMPAVRNVGGGTAGVAIAQTHRHAKAALATRGDVAGRPAAAVGSAAVGGASARAGTPGTPGAPAGTATPGKSGTGTGTGAAPRSSSSSGGSPHQTSSSTSSSTPGDAPAQTPSSSGSAPAHTHGSTSLPVSTPSTSTGLGSGTENGPTNTGSGSGGPVQSAVSTVQSTVSSASSTASSASSTAQAVVSTATSAVPTPPSPPKLP